MVDQEEQRLLNSEAILRNLVSEFKAQGIKIKIVDEDTIAYKGVQFDLLDSPTDTLNGIIYLESPSRQVIPIREENLVEGVESIMQYVESQKENPLRKWKKVKMSKNIRGHLDDADQIRQPIRDWYISAYPDDDLGTNLSDITFHDLHTGISQGLDVYDHIGVGDSIVRERLFDRLAELKSVSYDTIYDMWLNGTRKGMRKSSIVNVRSASTSNFTLNGEIVDVFLTDDGVYVGLSSNYDNQGHYDNSDDSLLYVSSLENVYHALFGSGWAYTFEEMTESFNTFASPEEVNRVRDYLTRLGYQERRIQTFGDGKGWDDYRASTKKSKKLSKNMKKYVEGTVSLPDPIILNVNGQMYELKSDSAYIPISMDFRKAEIRMDDIIIVARVEVKEPYFTYDWSVVAYHNNGWGSKIENVEPYYGFDIPIEDGIATNFREVSEALDHVIQDYRMQSISGYYPDYNASAKKSVPSFSQMMKSVKDGSFVSKAYLSDDYPTNSSGNYVVARKINGESMYNEHFDTKEEYDRFCQRLESSGWNRGREYPEENGAYITYWKDTD